MKLGPDLYEYVLEILWCEVGALALHCFGWEIPSTQGFCGWLGSPEPVSTRLGDCSYAARANTKCGTVVLTPILAM